MIVLVPSTVKFPLMITLPENVAVPVLLMFKAPEDAIVKFVPVSYTHLTLPTIHLV